MKKSILFAGFVVIVAAAGCQPKLSQYPMSEKEQQWKEFIQNDYPSWEPSERWPVGVRYDESYTPEELSRLEGNGSADTVEPLDIPADELMPDFQYDDVIAEEAEIEAPAVEEAVPAEPETVTVEHKVQQGDTLSGLALKYYGNASQWKQILDANPSLGGKPNKIRIGQVLVIPNPAKN